MSKDKKNAKEVVKTEQPETQVTDVAETKTEEVAPVAEAEVSDQPAAEQPEEKTETESPAESTGETVEFEWQQYWDPMAHSFKKRLVPKSK